MWAQIVKWPIELWVLFAVVTQYLLNPIPFLFFTVLFFRWKRFCWGMKLDIKREAREKCERGDTEGAIVMVVQARLRRERWRGRRERLSLILGLGWFFNQVSLISNWVGLILNEHDMSYPSWKWKKKKKKKCHLN